MPTDGKFTPGILSGNGQHTQHPEDQPLEYRIPRNTNGLRAREESDHVLCNLSDASPRSPSSVERVELLEDFKNVSRQFSVPGCPTRRITERLRLWDGKQLSRTSTNKRTKHPGFHRTCSLFASPNFKVNDKTNFDMVAVFGWFITFLHWAWSDVAPRSYKGSHHSSRSCWI